jgi:hypothetical protein
VSPLGRSPYARLWGGDSSLDPYTRLVSDTYQDAFGEGSFVGKGIYDVDAVDRVLEARLPDNKVLSHDLLEGCHARCGFLSDVQLLEDHPDDYLADARRRHRWIRGDWQISGWLRNRVPVGAGPRERNPLSLLAQWKILDNLRRSLVPLATVALFVVGWTATRSPVAWTLAVLALLLAPTLLDTVLELLALLRPATWRAQARERLARCGQRWARALLALTWLPHEAALSLDAIARSLWRLLVSRRRLLEWQPASGSVLAEQPTLAAYLRAMRAAPVVAVAGATWLALAGAAPIAVPILALWFVAPLLAWRVSRLSPVREETLTATQARELACAARRTWAFFEQFVGPQSGWLPPDNYQEEPDGRIAHRTSPTNLGLALLANLGAYDMGYLSAGRLLERTARMLEAMSRLERHAGHFLNWYETERGTPLHPRYVSSVDSGNLIGHLLVLRAGLSELAVRPIVEPAVFAGLRTTLELVEAGGTHDERVTARVSRLLDDVAAHSSADIANLHERLSALLAAARELEQPATATAPSGVAAPAPETAPAAVSASGSGAAWPRRLVAQCEDVLEDLRHLVPWSEDPPSADGTMELADRGDGTVVKRPPLFSGPVPTLAELAAIGGADESESERRPATPLEVSGERARGRVALIDELMRRCTDLAEANYSCVFDPSRKQFAIGYNVSDRRRDTSFYDLLASEARFAVFVAISQGCVPQESWFALGRNVTRVGGRNALLSWDGSMFEYLMPHLVMPAYPGTLIHESCRAAVARQVQFGRERDVPWGVSESGYYLTDAHANYQYRAFGVPGLGLRRGIGEDLVVAPYATCLALLVAPADACRNLERLRAEGMEGEFGFYEAVDYTPARLAPGATRGIVRSYMAHHQAMSLLAMVAVLCDRPMQRRFESEPLFRTSLLLLHERPRAGKSIGPVAGDDDAEASAIRRPEPSVRAYSSPDTPSPEVHLLSNGRYHVMVTNAGGGYSRWKDLAVTRWREDSTCDDFGVYCYLRDVDTGRVWSVTHQPALVPAEHYSPCSPRGAPSSRAVTATSNRSAKSRFRRRTTWSCAACASPIARARAARSSSRATWNSYSTRPPPRRCTRRSASCSSRPRSLRTSTRSSARAGRGHHPMRRRGPST